MLEKYVTMLRRYGLIALALTLIAPWSWGMEALPTLPAIPKDNPLSAAKIELGKMLFFEPRLSWDGTVACNTCHNVMSSGTDNRPVSVGISAQKGSRSAPTVWNAAFMTTQFWDGRATTLEDQAKNPILNPIMMGMPDQDYVLKRLRAIPEYQQKFSQAFGGRDAITFDNIARAIASYERTLITPNSALDRYLKGDKNALSRQALSGMKLVEETGCIACHNGVNFAGPDAPVGEGSFQKFPTYLDNKYVKLYDLLADSGRFGVTKNESDKNLWRVPTWRNIALTAPYFHNGAVKTLAEAVRVMAKTQLNKELTETQVDDIVAFLNSLTGVFPEQTMPHLPPEVNASTVGDK
ncbi:MAG: cytochrome-c peroxidase [Pseudomonadota bacterium]